MPDHGRNDAEKRFALDEMPVPMVYASYRIIRDCNVAFTELFGFTRDGIVGHSFAQLYPKLADFVRIGEIWKANLTSAQVYEDERIMRDVGGTRFWCRVSGRTRTPADPLAETVYCFQPLARAVRKAGHVSLSDRQSQILSRVAQGKTSVDIATETGLSRRTVESHRARLMKAVGVRNTAELIAWFSANKD